ncbi:rsuA [Acrasis kona]|uniref:RsuA n=1 Tax=Acrasis kona TaxID=1008807 RepID=A0AAW2YL65_9EUKA
MRIDRILTMCGYCTRSHASRFLTIHRFYLEGDKRRIMSTSKLIHDPTKLLMDGEPLEYPFADFTLLLHKPEGYICSTEREYEGAKIVPDLLTERFRNRHPALNCAGRLDIDTTGIVLMTQDGILQNEITSSRFEKEYIVKFTPPFEKQDDFEDMRRSFASGRLTLKKEKNPCLPASLELVSQDCVKVTITEGKYHQIKKMFACFGKRITQLKRIRIGHIVLDEDVVPEGSWRALTPKEIEQFRPSHSQS